MEVVIGSHKGYDSGVDVMFNADVLVVAAALAVMGIGLDQCLAANRPAEAPVLGLGCRSAPRYLLCLA